MTAATSNTENTVAQMMETTSEKDSPTVPLSHLSLAVNHEQQIPIQQIEGEGETPQIEGDGQNETEGQPGAPDAIDLAVARAREEDRRVYEAKIAELKRRSSAEVKAAADHQRELLMEEFQRKDAELQEKHDIQHRAPDLNAMKPTNEERKTARVQNTNMSDVITIMEVQVPIHATFEQKWGVIPSDDHIRVETVRTSDEIILKNTGLEADIAIKKRKIAKMVEDVIDCQKSIQSNNLVYRKLTAVETWRRAIAPPPRARVERQISDDEEENGEEGKERPIIFKKRKLVH